MKPRAAPRAPAGANPVAATPAAIPAATQAAIPAPAPAPAAAARASLSIIALSQDPMLLEALTLAAVGQASVVSSPSADRFADQLVATAAAVALIDAAAAPAPLEEFIASVKRQFPQLLLLLAGPAVLQNQFAAQLADGTIFRLAHKPASAQRLKLFVDAALLRRQTLIDQAGCLFAGTAEAALPKANPRSARSSGRRTWWVLAAAVVILIAAALGALLWRRPLSGSAPIPPGSDATTRAASAAAGSGALAAAATAGAASSPAPALSNDEAERDAIDRAAAERAEREQLISEAQRREAALAEQVRRTASGARAEQAHVYLQLARKRLASGALLTPADDSARSYLQAAQALAPSDADVQAVAAALDAALRAQSAPAAASEGAAAPDRAPQRAPDPTPAVTAAATAAAVTAAAAASSTSAAAPTTEPDVLPESLLQRAHFVSPVYPPDALARGLAGTVDLEFTVTPGGDVTDIAIQAAEPRGVFEQAAIAALSHSRYRPVQRDGVAIAQRARIRVRFQP